MEARRLVNERTGEVLATHVEVARSHLQRMRGLLGRSGLEPGTGMLFEGTGSIHMWFMRFPIDVLYLDRNARVVKVVHTLAPWRFSAARGAKTTIELAPGSLRAFDLDPGDLVRIEPVEPRS